MLVKISTVKIRIQEEKSARWSKDCRNKYGKDYWKLTIWAREFLWISWSTIEMWELNTWQK